jgi:hypothetical protein
MIGSAGKNRRRTPNPNVLVELGYALKALGDERVIVVVNTAFGKEELLPFDPCVVGSPGCYPGCYPKRHKGPRVTSAWVHFEFEIGCPPAGSNRQPSD